MRKAFLQSAQYSGKPWNILICKQAASQSGFGVSGSSGDGGLAVPHVEPVHQPSATAAIEGMQQKKAPRACATVRPSKLWNRMGFSLSCTGTGARSSMPRNIPSSMSS